MTLSGDAEWPPVADAVIEADTLIHAAANFASFLAFRGLSINESTFCRMVWK